MAAHGRPKVRKTGRVNVTFNHVVLPNGQTYRIQAIALWGDASGGLVGELFDMKGQQVASLTALGALSGITNTLAFTAAPGSAASILGAAGGGAAAGAAEVSQEQLAQQVAFAVDVPRFVNMIVYLVDALILEKGEAAIGQGRR